MEEGQGDREMIGRSPLLAYLIGAGGMFDRIMGRGPGPRGEDFNIPTYPHASTDAMEKDRLNRLKFPSRKKRLQTAGLWKKHR